MKIINNPPIETWDTLLQRPTQNFKNIESTVNQVFSEIKTKGDEAVKKYTLFFDGVNLNNFKVTQEEVEIAKKQVPGSLKKAIKQAKQNIERFHKAQKPDKIKVTTMPGVTCWQEYRAIERVGLYIPGGSAPLFSSVIMLAVPAKIAGCKEIVLCTPPNKEGTINPAILYAADLCGIKSIYKIGGIQAIGALTFGTESIPKVYKIFGPGNQFVTVAKQIATKYNVAIDMPAGPSEVMVVADSSAKASFVAADLLSQAEHGTDSQVVLLSTDKAFINKVIIEIKSQIEFLPRKPIINEALKNAKFICVEDNNKALQIINFYGPEHLIIATKNTSFFVDNVNNAGSVFIGNFSPESAGDYASGTNHTLPTNGFSKAYSGVTLQSFLKSITFQKLTKNGLKSLAETITTMATAEGLEAHKRAVSIRLKTSKNG